MTNTATDCSTGYHPELDAQPPVHHPTCVNVDYVCPKCGVVAATDSFTLAGWEAEKRREARLARKAPVRRR